MNEQKIALAEKAYEFQLVYVAAIEKRMEQSAEDLESFRASEIRRQMNIERQIYSALASTRRKQEQYQRRFDSASSLSSIDPEEVKSMNAQMNQTDCIAQEVDAA